MFDKNQDLGRALDNSRLTTNLKALLDRNSPNNTFSELPDGVRAQLIAARDLVSAMCYPQTEASVAYLEALESRACCKAIRGDRRAKDALDAAILLEGIGLPVHDVSPIFSGDTEVRYNPRFSRVFALSQGAFVNLITPEAFKTEIEALYQSAKGQNLEIDFLRVCRGAYRELECISYVNERRSIRPAVDPSQGVYPVLNDYTDKLPRIELEQAKGIAERKAAAKEVLKVIVRNAPGREVTEDRLAKVSGAKDEIKRLVADGLVTWEAVSEAVNVNHGPLRYWAKSEYLAHRMPEPHSDYQMFFRLLTMLLAESKGGVEKGSYQQLKDQFSHGSFDGVTRPHSKVADALEALATHITKRNKGNMSSTFDPAEYRDPTDTLSRFLSWSLETILADSPLLSRWSCPPATVLRALDELKAEHPKCYARLMQESPRCLEKTGQLVPLDSDELIALYNAYRKTIEG